MCLLIETLHTSSRRDTKPLIFCAPTPPVFKTCGNRRSCLFCLSKAKALRVSRCRLHGGWYVYLWCQTLWLRGRRSSSHCQRASRRRTADQRHSTVEFVVTAFRAFRYVMTHHRLQHYSHWKISTCTNFSFDHITDIPLHSYFRQIFGKMHRLARMHTLQTTDDGKGDRQTDATL